MTIGKFFNPIITVSTGGTGTTTTTTTLAPTAPWVKPDDWFDLSSESDNEILMTVGDNGSGINLKCTTSTGTYSIDWGDGNIDSNCTSTTTYSHKYSYSGTTTSTGMKIWKVKIYNFSGNCSGFFLVKPSTSYNSNIYDINISCSYISNWDNLFFSVTTGSISTTIKHVKIKSFGSATSARQLFRGITDLEWAELPETWGNVTNAESFFYDCDTINSIILPTTWGSITSGYNFCYNCINLENINLPTSWGNLPDLSWFFYGTLRLKNVTLPTSWGVATKLDSFFQNSIIDNVIIPDSWGNAITVNNFFYNSFIKNVTLPTSWGNVTEAKSFFFDTDIKTVTLPNSWGNITNLNSFFSQCKKLQYVTLPTSWDNVTQTLYMFYFCDSLTNVTLPTSWGNMTNVQWMFYGCSVLTTIILPTSGSTKMVVSDNMFGSCNNLTNISGLEYIGSDSGSTFANFITTSQYISSGITINSKINDNFGCIGALGKLLYIYDILLTNSSSTYSGTNPSIDVSYCSLSGDSINNLLLCIPDGLTAGKQIKLTGNPGYDTLLSKSSCGSTASGNTITCSNTSGLYIGMEVYGTSNISGTRACTFQGGGVDTVTRTAHGFSDGSRVAFTTITTTTGISPRTIYYVINSTANTFQLSKTVGGSVITLTNNGTGSVIYQPVITNIVTNTNISIDCNAFLTGSFTMTASRLNRYPALLHQWTIS